MGYYLRFGYDLDIKFVIRNGLQGKDERGKGELGRRFYDPFNCLMLLSI